MSFSLKELKEISLDDLDPKERQKCQEAFVAFDKNGSKMIEKEELRKVLEEMGQCPSEEELIKMINEVDTTGFEDFLRVIAFHKKIQQNSEEEEIILAFVALGGNEDKSGYINRNQLEEVILESFNLTIDLNRLVKELAPTQTNISYEDFRNLLSN